MGGINPSIALQGQVPQLPGPIDNYEKGLSVQSLINQQALQKQAQQSNQIGLQQQQIQLQEQQRQEADRQKFNQAFHDAHGDWDKAITAAPDLGVSGQYMIQAQQARAEQVSKLALATKQQLENETQKHEALGVSAQKVLDADPADQQQIYAQERNSHLITGAYKPSDIPEKMPPTQQLQELANTSKFVVDLHKEALDEKTKQAELPGKQATSDIEVMKRNLMQSSNPTDFTSAIDTIAPPTGATAGLNARTKANVALALKSGNLDAARKAVDEASSQQNAIEKETSPALLAFDARKTANAAAIQQAVKDGSAEDAGKMLQQRIVAPSEIAARSNPAFLVKAIKTAQGLEPGFNAAKAEADFNVAKSPQNVTFFGSANSLTNKGGSLDQLEDQYKKLPNGKLPALNKISDWISASAGKGATAGFAQTALGVADDYAKVMGGGTGSDTSRQQVLESFAQAHSPEQFKSAVAAARAAVGSQQDARIGGNPILKNMYGGGTAASRTDKVQENSAKPSLQVGQMVSVKGKQRKITAVHPDGSFDAE